MKFYKSLAFLITFFFFIDNSFSQCFEIESILVDACDNGADEAYNEMFRMKIGGTALNTSTLNINWPAQTWLGLVQNATTASKVSQLNAAIVASGSCGQILEPIGGVLPANASVIVVTSPNLDTTLNSFGSLTSTIYMIFQNTPANANAGHFGNYNATPATRTLSVTFGAGCSDSVTYQRSNLFNIFGVIGGSISDLNGSTVNFTPSGTATYVNNGCIAPVQPFTVEAGTTPISACAGQTINLNGTAQGQTSVSWSAASGSFSTTNNLSTSYTIPSTATSGSSITLTLTATNSCAATITDNIIINITGNTLTLNSANNTQNICSGNAISIIQYTFGGGATSVSVTGLPTGVTASTSGNVVTISGTPATDFSYTINTVGGCGTTTQNGTVAFSSNATLTLNSSAASTNQFVCINQSINPIFYSFGGGATGVTITGLPTSVNATTIGNTVTINGTPTSDFTYSITTVGGCGSVTLNGSVTVTSTIVTLSLNSANNTQNICFGTAIAPIQYTFGGSATSVNVTDLPTGVTASIIGNSVTISGTPTTAFNYSVITVGGCGGIATGGSVAFLTNTATLAIVSANNTQNICSGTAIAPIQYTFGGGATSATVSGLPTSVTASISGNVVTLSGTPSTNFAYTISTNGGCGTVTLNGTISLSANATLTLDSANNTQNICSGTAISAIQYTFGGGATSATVTGLPAGVTASTSGNVVLISGTPSANFTYTISTNGGCGTVTLNGTISLSANATLTLDSANNTQNICSGNAISAIQYTFGGGATSATVTGLPAGVTASTSGNVVLISGTPSANYTYTISTNDGCGSINATGTITVVNGILPTFNQVTPVCQGSTINIPTSSTNTPPIVGVWNLISSTANDVTYEFTPNAGQCGLTTTMTIVVHPLPTVTPSVTTQSFCSGGTTNINLLSDVPGSEFYWTATGTSVSGQSGSVTGSGATSINQTLTLNAGQVAAGQVTYTIVAEANGCLGAPVTVVVTVNPIPNVIVSPVSLTETICSGGTTNISFTGAINNTVYTWSVVSSVGVSGALNGVGTSINQILTTTGLSQGTVVYEVTPSLNGCPGTPQRITVTVNPVPELFGSTTHRDLCSGEPTNILVSTFNAATVFNWVVEPNGVSGASAGTDTGLSINIVQTLTTTGNVRGYVDYIITPVLTGCSGIPITVRVYVNPLPVVSLTDGTICVDAAGVPFQSYVLDSGLNDVDYDFVWTFEGNTIPGETSSTHTATQVGTYTVVATNSTTNCVSNIASAVVTATNPATSLTVTQSEYFSDNATLVVTVTGGNGTLLYQLDQGILQESNVFTGVTGGTHDITVVDTQGCTYLTQKVLVIDYPKYFTPNGDGHNDTWNITGMDQSDAKLFIFDRYGKLLKQLSATTASEGWNGIYNNEKLPSTDYWFTLDYTENGAQKQFKAHFSLKR